MIILVVLVTSNGRKGVLEETMLGFFSSKEQLALTRRGGGGV